MLYFLRPYWKEPWIIKRSLTCGSHNLLGQRLLGCEHTCAAPQRLRPGFPERDKTGSGFSQGRGHRVQIDNRQGLSCGGCTNCLPGNCEEHLLFLLAQVV
jgi:hypothetical protein